MSAPARPSASLLASPATLVGAVRQFARRRHLGRLLAAVVLGLVVASVLRDADRARTDALARWDATEAVWVVTAPIDAGEPIEPGSVERRLVPTSLVPVAATHADPSGRRTRVTLLAGEIVVEPRLSDAGSAVAARTPDGWHTIGIGRRDELFTEGDRLDLHHLIDGHRLTSGAVVVAITDTELGVAVPPDDVGEVVRALGQAGVVPVLTG